MYRITPKMRSIKLLCRDRSSFKINRTILNQLSEISESSEDRIFNFKLVCSVLLLELMKLNTYLIHLITNLMLSLDLNTEVRAVSTTFYRWDYKFNAKPIPLIIICINHYAKWEDNWFCYQNHDWGTVKCILTREESQTIQQ